MISKPILSVIASLFVTTALAQQPPAITQQPTEYILKVTPADTDLISDGLQTQPFGKVYPLIQKLREQIVSQQPKAADPPKPDAGK